jgi:hypothetical protein
MKVFIIRKEIEHEYAITKVSDDLVEEFEQVNKDKIVLEGSSLQDALIKFSALEKEPEIPFNPVLIKVRNGDREKSKK